MRPQTIQIFLPDGTATGVKEAELTNRLVKALLVPRTAMDKGAKRELSAYTGVYFLFGQDDHGKDMIYIGEGENCWNRILQHHRKKDFWTHCVMMVSKTDEYTKTDVKFLEHYCLKEANKVGRYCADNDTGSREPSIGEARKYDLLDNFDTIKILLTTLGYPVFVEVRGDDINEEKYFCKGKDAQGVMVLTDEGYVVLKGSKCNLTETKTAGTWVVSIRKKLKDSGVLIEQSGVLEFVNDYKFNSASASAACLLARRANGWKEWKSKDGKTLDEIKRN